MVAPHLGPVVDELELLLAFRQRAIASRHAQAVSETRNDAALAAIISDTVLSAYRIRAEKECTQACRFGVTGVCVRDSEIRHRSTTSGLLRLWVVLEISKAKVGQQRTADCFCKAARQTVVVRDRAACQTEQAITRPTNGTQ